MSELEQTFQRMLDKASGIDKNQQIIEDVKKVWATEQGKRLAWVLLKKSGYFDEVPKGEEVKYCALRNLVNEVFFLTADVKDIAITITQGDKYVG